MPGPSDAHYALIFLDPRVGQYVLWRLPLRRMGAEPEPAEGARGSLEQVRAALAPWVSQLPLEWCACYARPFPTFGPVAYRELCAAAELVEVWG